MSNENGLVGFNQNEINKIPVGGTFTPSGMIGKFSARVMFSFYSKTDIAIIEMQPPEGLVINKMGDGFRYYLRDSEKLDEIRQAMGEPYAPNQVWNFYVPNNTVVNVPADTLKKFQNVILSDVGIATLQSNKQRHEFHMIALPAFVRAVAKALGYDVPNVSFNDLIGNQVIFSDELMEKMIGLKVDPTKQKKDKYVNAGYAKSQLWQQRAVLWQALGESDATKYQCTGTGTEFDTTSEKLNKCLEYVKHPWQDMWGRLIQVPDPRIDAVKSDGTTRLNIPAFVEIFSEKVARETGAKELAERAARDSAKSNSNGQSSDSLIPEAWKPYPDDWNNLIADLKTKTAGKNPPAVKTYIDKLIKEGESKGEPVLATTEQILAAMKA